jgi:hypothetical protein
MLTTLFVLTLVLSSLLLVSYKQNQEQKRLLKFTEHTNTALSNKLESLRKKSVDDSDCIIDLCDKLSECDNQLKISDFLNNDLKAINIILQKEREIYISELSSMKKDHDYLVSRDEQIDHLLQEKNNSLNEIELLNISLTDLKQKITNLLGGGI